MRWRTFACLAMFIWEFPRICSASEGVRVLRCDERMAIVEVCVEEGMEEREARRDRVRIRGCGVSGRAGAPQIPTKGIVLGVPPGAEVRLNADAGPYSEREGYALPPVPRVRSADGQGRTPSVEYVYERDPQVYGADAFYPGKGAEIVGSGILRGRHVVVISAYPVHYNPVRGTVRVYRKIRLEVRFEMDAGRARVSGRVRPDPLDAVLRGTLVNHSQAMGWFRPEAKRKKEMRKPAAFGPWYKVKVEEDGMYRVDRSALSDAGVDVEDVDPRTLRLYHLGQEVPLLVSGEEDGRFDEGDHIVFHGTRWDGRYTRTNVYWLTWGAMSGERMAGRSGPAGPSASFPTCFLDSLRVEQDKVYWQTAPGGEDADHWFWEELRGAGIAEARFVLHGIADTAATCRLRATFQGRTGANHRAIVSMNGHPMGNVEWSGQRVWEAHFSVPQSYLREGENILTIERPEDADAEADRLLLNRLDLAYWRRYLAREGRCWFRGKGAMRASGFGAEGVRVFDITDMRQPVEIVGVRRDEGGIVFSDPREDVGEYLAVREDRFLRPLEIMLDRPSDLRDPEDGADYVAIVYDEFYEQVRPLVTWRGTRGLRARAVKLGDVYDEFNFGIPDPEAIRTFLRYAYFHWSPPPPAYVLLVGDATLDPLDHFGLGKRDFVPTYLTDAMAVGETGSDSWFVCVDGEDRLPDMAIGRIPARDETDVAAALEKILRYESAENSEAWNRTVLFAAGTGAEFEAASDAFAIRLPEEFVAEKVYRGQLGDAAKSALIDRLNAGAVLTSYLGHGNVHVWGEGMFGPEDLGALHNREYLSFVMMLSCLNGFFMHPFEDYSLAEQFLRYDGGGAIACWSPSGLGWLEDYTILEEAFLRTVFEDGIYALGAATTAAKIAGVAGAGFSGTMMDLVDVLTLFGDPATELALPKRKIALVGAGPEILVYVDGRPLEEDARIPSDAVFTGECRSRTGIDPSTLRLVLDGEVVSRARMEVESEGFRYAVRLSEGPHTLTVRVAGRDGAMGERRISFEVRSDLSLEEVAIYPNPATEEATFTYRLSKPASVTVKIYTTYGRLVRTLRTVSMGDYDTIFWDGRDREGDRLANGPYLCKITAEDGRESVYCIEKLVVMR